MGHDILLGHRKGFKERIQGTIKSNAHYGGALHLHTVRIIFWVTRDSDTRIKTLDMVEPTEKKLHYCGIWDEPLHMLIFGGAKYRKPCYFRSQLSNS